MKKPKKTTQTYWDYNKCIEWIEHKYKIQTRGYKQDEDGVYRDYWHEVLDCFSGNGSFGYLPNVKDLKEFGCRDRAKDCWMIEITELLEKEFPGITGEQVYVWW